MNKIAYFFDMDGVLFDSMPHHAVAWTRVMQQHGLPFSEEEVYRNEGRTGFSVIEEAISTIQHRHADREEVEAIYAEKTALFHELGETFPIPGVKDVLAFLRSQGALIFIVTGSGQHSLFDRLDHVFPGIFKRDRMVTGLDVKKGKPDPEPYLMGFERAVALYETIPLALKAERRWPDHLSATDCAVIENAPLGVRSGSAAGLDVYAVNTGPLPDDCLLQEGAKEVFASMQELLAYLKIN